MNLRTFKRIVAEYAGIDDISDISMDMTFSDDIVLDDEHFFELIEQLEDEFDVDLLSFEGDFDSLGELAQLIKQG